MSTQELRAHMATHDMQHADGDTTEPTDPASTLQGQFQFFVDIAEVLLRARVCVGMFVCMCVCLFVCC